jgi:hypothetical protein
MRISIDTRKDPEEVINKAVDLIRCAQMRHNFGYDEDAASEILAQLTNCREPMQISVLQERYKDRGLSPREFLSTIDQLKSRGDIYEPRRGWIEGICRSKLDSKPGEDLEGPIPSQFNEIEHHFIIICKTHLMRAIFTYSGRKYPTCSLLSEEMDMVEDGEYMPLDDSTPNRSRESMVVILSEQKLVAKARETILQAHYPDIDGRLVHAALMEIEGTHLLGPYRYVISSRGEEGKRIFTTVF